MKIHRDTRKVKYFLVISFMNIVTINLYVFGAFMGNQIGSNLNSTLVVYIKKSRLLLRETKLS